MPMTDVVELGRLTVQTAVLVAAPLLVIATIVSLVVSILQVLTSVQDNTVATVPRLGATAVAAVLLLPWMLRHLATFTTTIINDLPRWTR